MFLDRDDDDDDDSRPNDGLSNVKKIVLIIVKSYL